MTGNYGAFQGHQIISDQVSRAELELIWRTLSGVLQREVPGHIVEFGCYVGTTSLYLRRLLDATKQSDRRELHVYDSFSGLPEKVAQDESSAGSQFKAGELGVSKKELLLQFRKAGLQPPHIHKGWFANLIDQNIPSPIAFAFLDGDFYESIMDSLKLVWPRLSAGGIVAIDDYQREALPGVERAIHDFFNGQPPTLQHQASIAIIRKA